MIDCLKSESATLFDEAFNSSKTFIRDLLYQLPDDTQVTREDETPIGPVFTLGPILSPTVADRINQLNSHFPQTNICRALLGPDNTSLRKLITWISKNPENSTNPSTAYYIWVNRLAKPIEKLWSDMLLKEIILYSAKKFHSTRTS